MLTSRKICAVLLMALACWIAEGTGHCGFAENKQFALFPIADISSGDNGIDLDFTRQMFQALTEQGMSLTPMDEMLRFLSQNRIRNAGWLDALTVRKMGRQFGCDLVLIGALTENDEKNQTIGFTLSAMDAQTGLPVWGGTRAANLDENQHALGIGDPESMDEIMPQLFSGLFSEISEKTRLQRVASKDYQIMDVQVSPNCIRGGTLVDCKIRIEFYKQYPDKIAIVNGHGKQYLQKNGKPGVYRGQWTAPPRNGYYPVAILLEWDDGRPSERIPNVGSYVVINDPPKLKLDIKNGLALGDVTVFNDYLIFLPQLETPRMISRWEASITDQQGAQVLRQGEEGNLPARLVWTGSDAQNKKLLDNVYAFTLTVWDEAGNSACASEKIAVQSSVSPVAVAVVRLGNKTYLKIQPSSGLNIPLVSWNLDARSPEGQDLIRTEGEKLPTLIEIPLRDGEQNILCNLEVRDQLGNLFSLLDKEIRIQGARPASTDKKTGGSAWIEGF